MRGYDIEEFGTKVGYVLEENAIKVGYVLERIYLWSIQNIKIHVWKRIDDKAP